ncbi:MAG TPA: hypothetical protein VNU68_30925 [Verrucomicrobiae bacterium]|nr:hypothetical protein [Verrucomicrobiae bacterium]
MISSHRHAGWRFLALGLAGLAVVWLAGCLVIPVNHYQTGSRHKVNAKSLQPGVTTKEELVLMLGEPDFYSEDEQRFGYAWTKVKAVWVVQGMGRGESERSYVLEASFDASNRLSQVRLLKNWGDPVNPTRELKSTP